MNLYTTKQINDGIVDILTIDMTQYAKKDETVSKDEINTLTEVVANKLDASPMHHHDIQHIDELQNQLNNKLNSNQRYSYNTILSDSEKIDYLEKLNTDSLSVSNEYKMNINSVDDLVIKNGESTIATFVKNSNEWNVKGISETLTEHADVLDNHRQAIELLNTSGYDDMELRELINSKADVNHTHDIKSTPTYDSTYRVGTFTTPVNKTFYTTSIDGVNYDFTFSATNNYFSITIYYKNTSYYEFLVKKRNYPVGSQVLSLTSDTTNITSDVYEESFIGATDQITLNDADNNLRRDWVLYMRNIMTNQEFEIVDLPVEEKKELIDPMSTVGNIGYLLDLIYPVGSIYVSMLLLDPSKLFGGVWSRINDRFLYVTGSSDHGSSLQTGGSKKITIAQLPPHEHRFNDYSFTWHWGQTEAGTNTVHAEATCSDGASNDNFIHAHLDIHNKTRTTGSGEDYMPPYITVYAWYRVG